MPRLPGEATTIRISDPRKNLVRGARDPVAPAIAQAGSNIAGASNELHQAFEQEQYRFDMSRTEDAYNQLIQGSIDLSVGEEGYQKQLGGDAINKPLLKDTMDRYEELQSGISGGLDNPRQREEFTKRMEVQKGRMAQGVLSHQQTENRVYRAQLLEATKQTGADEAGMNYDKMGIVDGTLVRWKALVNEDAEINGYAGSDEKSQAIRDAKYMEGTTLIHEAVIENAIMAEKPGYAKAWLKAHRDEIDSKTAKRLDKMVETSSVRAASQGYVDKVWAMGGSNTEKLAMMRKVNNPAEREAALSLAKARISEEASLKNIDEANAKDEAWKVIGTGGIEADVPIPVIDAMNGEDVAKMQTYLKARDSIEQRKHNAWAVLNDVEDMIKAGDITDEDQLLPFKPFFVDGTYTALVNSVQKRMTVPPAVIEKAWQNQTGYSRKDTLDSEGSREEWLEFKSYILDNVKQTNRPEDVDVWADRWFMSGAQRDAEFWKNDPNTFGEAMMAGRVDQFLIDTPDDDRASVSEAISVLGRNDIEMQTGDVAIDEFYTKYYGGAVRWLNAHDTTPNATSIAAYAYLIGIKKPITPTNMNQAIRGLSQ
jgi:hypothetical protein